MEQVIAVEIAVRGERIDECERELWPVRHGDRRRAVQGHDGRRLDALEKVIEPDDLRPVRLFGARRLAMQDRDSSRS